MYDKESVGIGRKGTIDKPFYFAEPFWTVDTLFWSKIKQGYSPKFIYYLFQTIDWRKLNQSTGVPSLTSHVIEHKKVYIPNINEQSRIADFFSFVDLKIKLIESKIIALKKYKKGLAQLAIHDTVKNWIKESCDALPLGCFITEENEYCENDGTYPHVTLSKDGIDQKSERYDRDFLVKDDNKKYKITRYNQLCYNPANLKFGVICINRFGQGIFSPIYITYRIHDINLEYLELIITSDAFRNYSMKYQQGTVFERMSVSPEDLARIKIVVADEQTQIRISKATSRINMKIKSLNAQLKHLSDIKLQLLNSMFI